jgi:GH15 family glucan-1,4-alpha-glucosidase
MCTFWLVEALTRVRIPSSSLSHSFLTFYPQAGAYEKEYLVRAISIFENMLGFANHLDMFSEEIASSGEQLGNTPQAFSHLALISAAFNLDRVTSGAGGM